MEKSLLKNTVNFKEIFEALPVVFLILKPDAPLFTILEVNHLFIKLSGRLKEELVDHSLFDILPNDETVSNLKTSLEKVIRKKTIDRLPIQHYDTPNPENGVMEEAYWLAKNTPVLNSSGEIDYIIHQVENVTEMVKSEKKRNEELERHVAKLAESYHHLEQVNNELDAFTYSVSHDLRAPLRAINGYSRMLLEDYSQELKPEAGHCLDTIINNAMHMGALIDDLLAFSRLGKQNTTKVPLNMDAIADSVVTELRISAPAHTQIFLKPLAIVEGDSNMIRLVMANLIANAIKYSHKKEHPIIEVGCLEEEDRNVYYVKDNGAGFDMKYYDKLFGVFQRLHSKHEFEGTGVGLALVDRIVKKHGGETWGEGITDQGATFYFSLPVTKLMAP